MAFKNELARISQSDDYICNFIKISYKCIQNLFRPGGGIFTPEIDSRVHFNPNCMAIIVYGQ